MGFFSWKTADTQESIPVWASSRPTFTVHVQLPDGRDYAMRNGVLKLKVREAMEGYLRDRLGLATTDGKPALRLLV